MTPSVAIAAQTLASGAPLYTLACNACERRVRGQPHGLQQNTAPPAELTKRAAFRLAAEPVRFEDQKEYYYTQHEIKEMWRSSTATSHEHDEFYIDKDGIPHWNGSDPAKYLKQYKSRVLIEYETTVGDSEVAKECRVNLALRLTRGLTGKAWDIVEPLLQDLEKLKVEGGHKLVLLSLDTLDKEAVLKKQEKFDDFFKRSWRRQGQEIGDYIREKEHKYAELTRLDTTTKLSDDLYAYFLLGGARLKDDQRKLVTMVADNEFETKSFVRTLRTNFHDVHVGEKRNFSHGTGDKGKTKGSGKGKFQGKKRFPEKANYLEYKDEEYEHEEDEANVVDEDSY